MTEHMMISNELGEVYDRIIQLNAKKVVLGLSKVETFELKELHKKQMDLERREMFKIVS